MRDYSKMTSAFWTGRTGKALRGNPDAQLLAAYLVTCGHSNMIGVYYCPVVYMAHETGLGIEGASKALQRLMDEGFCTYDEGAETVWVHEMARFQIGELLKAEDKQVISVAKQFLAMPDCAIKSAFYEKYRSAFHLPEWSPPPVDKSARSKPLRSPSEAPPKPGTGTGDRTGTGERRRTADLPPVDKSPPNAGEPSAPPVASPPARRSVASRGQRLPADWVLPKAWGDWALKARADLTADDVRREAENFRDHWLAKAGADATKVDWEATWRKWMRSDLVKPKAAPGEAGGKALPWFISSSGVEAKATELGVVLAPGEQWQVFKLRVWKAAGVTDEMVRKAQIDAGQRPA